MFIRKVARPLAATSALLVLSSLALADVSIEDVRVRIVAGKKIEVAVDLTGEGKAVVSIQGQIGAGTAMVGSKKGKVKAGKTKTVKVKFDAKKLGIQGADASLFFGGQITAQTAGQAEAAGAQFQGVLPKPILFFPGLANELSGKKTFIPFLNGLNAAAGLGGLGSPYTTKGPGTNATVNIYRSLSDSVEKSGFQAAKKIQKAVKRTRGLFTCVDVIGYSTGGIVVRQAMIGPPLDVGAKAPPSARGLVDNFIMLATPNEGIPLAFLARAGNDTGTADTLIPIVLAELGDNPSAAGLAFLLSQPAFGGSVNLFIPDFPFALVAPETLLTLPQLTGGLPGGPEFPELAGLNNTQPDPAADYHAIVYTSVADSGSEIDSVDGLDLIAFNGGGGTDPSLVSLISGQGDGITPLQSCFMRSHGVWNDVITEWALGPGLHSPNTDDPTDLRPGYLNDASPTGAVAVMVGILLSPPQVPSAK